MKTTRAMLLVLAGIVAALVWVFLRLALPEPQQEESRKVNLASKQADTEGAVEVADRKSQAKEHSPVANPTALAETQGESNPAKLSSPLAAATNQSLKVTIHQPKNSTFITTDEAATYLELVWIPSGSFVLGSQETETGRRSNEGPQTKVTISRGYWLGKYEVTTDQFRLTTNGRLPWRNQYTGTDPDSPISNFGWQDAMSFCAYLTEQENGAGNLPEGYLYRLPTEAEWEYACRAGTTTRFSFGDDLAYTAVDSYAWFAGNSEGRLHPIGIKLPNAWGLCDMHGNSREWCLDDLGPNYPGGNITDPVGLIGGRYQAWRGGAAADGGGDTCRSAFRGRTEGEPGLRFAGFRVALAPQLIQQQSRN